MLRAQAVLKVADQTVAARQLVADQVTALAESKLKSTLDVSFANVNLSDAKLLLVQAQNDLKAAEADLATAMGLPNEAGFVLQEEPMPAPLPDRVDDLIRAGHAEPSRVEGPAAAGERRRALHARPSTPSTIPPSAWSARPASSLRAYETVPGRYGAIGMNVSIPIFNGGLSRPGRPRPN